MKLSRLVALMPLAVLVAGPLAAQEGQPPTYTSVGQSTAPVADAYFSAYIARDWASLEPLLVAESSFEDPTATYVFGGVLSEGREAMMMRFREGYAGISHMRFDTTRRVVSADTAIYEGNLDWGLDLGEGLVVESVTPMVIILTVKDGKVVQHRDYVDYAPFLAALQKARSEK